MKGSYVLVIELPEEQAIVIGGLKVIHFPRGYYAYVGSALGGLESRLSRHLRRNKKLRWHIDYLLRSATVRAVIYAETDQKKECLVAQVLSWRLPSLLGFGCSDCDCPSHLFFCQDLEVLTECIIDGFKLVKLNPLQINY